MTESKNTFKTIWVAVAIFCFTISASSLAFSSDETVVKDGRPAIVKVFGAPVGIESNFFKELYVDESKMCHISYGVIPRHTVKIKLGETLRIKVIGDADIVVRCNGKMKWGSGHSNILR